MNIQKSLNNAMIVHNIKNKDLAKGLKMSESTVSLVRAGKRKVSTDTLELLAHFFDMPVSDFVKLGE